MDTMYGALSVLAALDVSVGFSPQYMVEKFEQQKTTKSLVSGNEMQYDIPQHLIDERYVKLILRLAKTY